MKKLTSLVLALIVLMMCPLMAMADYDMSVVLATDAQKLVTVDYSSDNSVAYVESVLTSEMRAFVHPDEHEDWYNNTMFDIIVLDPYTDAFPAMRLWVRYYGHEFLNIEGITFKFGGKSYTFTDVSDPARKEVKEGAYNERLMMIFGLEQAGFIVDLEDYVAQFETVEEMDQHPITMILHGDRDVEVTLDGSFMLDFKIIKTFFVRGGGVDYMTEVTGTPMTTK